MKLILFLAVWRMIQICIILYPASRKFSGVFQQEWLFYTTRKLGPYVLLYAIYLRTQSTWWLAILFITKKSLADIGTSFESCDCLCTSVLFCLVRWNSAGTLQTHFILRMISTSNTLVDKVVLIPVWCFLSLTSCFTKALSRVSLLSKHSFTLLSFCKVIFLA